MNISFYVNLMDRFPPSLRIGPRLPDSEGGGRVCVTFHTQLGRMGKAGVGTLFACFDVCVAIFIDVMYFLCSVSSVPCVLVEDPITAPPPLCSESWMRHSWQPLCATLTTPRPGKIQMLVHFFRILDSGPFGSCGPLRDLKIVGLFQKLSHAVIRCARKDFESASAMFY